MFNADFYILYLARDNSSTIIEVRKRPNHAQWRYRLDVFADGKRIYFDRSSLKLQHFRGTLQIYIYIRISILVLYYRNISFSESWVV